MLNTFYTLVQAILENVRAEIRREGHQCSPEVEAILNRALNNLINQTPVLAKPVQQPSVGVAPTQPRSNQCNGVTKKGTRCSKNKMNGSEYCHAHAGTSGPMTTAQAAFSSRGLNQTHQQQASVAMTSIKGLLETRTPYTNQFNVPSASTMTQSQVAPPHQQFTTSQVNTPPSAQQFNTGQSQVNQQFTTGNTFQQFTTGESQVNAPPSTPVNTPPSGNTFQQMYSTTPPPHQQFTTGESQVTSSDQSQVNPPHQQFTTNQSQVTPPPSAQQFTTGQVNAPPSGNTFQQFTTTPVNAPHQQFNTSSDPVETASDVSDPYAE